MLGSQAAIPRPRPIAWGREVLSAFAAALVAIPAAIANGLVMYAPLGPAYAGAGALAGVVGAGVLGTIAGLLGGAPGLVSAPSPAAAAFMAVLASQLVRGGTDPAAVPAALAVVILVAGVVQISAGLARGGRLVKFLPYPVVAGYLTGGGLLILHLQMSRLVGAPSRWGAVHTLSHPGAWSGSAVCIASVTIAVALLAPRLTRRVPATLIGLGAGVLAHQLLALRWPELRCLDSNPLLVGNAFADRNPAVMAGVARSVASALSLDVLRDSLVPGATLGILLSIDTLKTCLLVDATTRNRHDSDREIVGQGVGNAASALLGGAPGTGIVSASMVNVTSGARTRWSGVLAGGLALAALLALGRAIAWLPIPALAAIVTLMAWRMLQSELVELLRDRGTIIDFAVAAAVVAVAIALNLAAAAGVGFALSVLLFLFEHARAPVVRRIMDGSTAFAQSRGENESTILDRRVMETLFVELQGSLFFGTADRVTVELLPMLPGRRFIILDLSRVTSVDVSAVYALKPLASRLAAQGGRLIICEEPGGAAGRRFATFAERLGLPREPFSALLLPHVEDALEWAEERILGEARMSRPPLALEEFDLVRTMPAGALQALRDVATERRIARGERVFTAGSAGREMFLVRAGQVRVVAPAVGGRSRVLTTLGPGEFFGDLAYLDGSARSADVVATRDTDLFVLASGDVTRAAQRWPGLEPAITAQLALALAQRLRRATSEARRLRDS